MDFGVAVRERKAASAVMVRGGDIDDLSGFGIGFGHGYGEGGIVDAIGMLVEEDPCFSGDDDGAAAFVDAPGRRGEPSPIVKGLAQKMS